jgi:predicted flap endonuclease-1-like 5' DNA nuclease
MTYLIGHLALWLLLTAAFAGLAGWSFAALRAAPAEAGTRRERDRLMRDLLAISVENGAGGVPPELDREIDTLRRRADLDAARVAELERALETARARAEDAGGRVAELERGMDRNDEESQELTRLREELAAVRTEEARTVEVEAAAPEEGESAVLQSWRLRYFEQRVRYLENHARAERAGGAEQRSPDAIGEGRALAAEARVAHLEAELRETASQAPGAVAEASDSPFAANAETDMLLRWRMLYLEKRVAHLQSEQHAEAPETLAPAMDAEEEAEKWKWRARYLEARTRQLEQDLAAAQAQAPEPVQTAAPEAMPIPKRVLETENDEEEPPRAPAPLVPAGAVSLIEGVSQLQHSTLNSLGIHHFDQIAAWTPANIAWVDQYLRLRGRIVDEEWVEQAQDLVREGPLAARRVESEDA